MKSLSRIAAATLGFGLSSLAHGQTASVVTDPGLTAATAAGFVEQAAKTVEQIEQLRQQVEQAKAQLEQAKSHYDALTGSRNLGEVLNNPVYRDYLPQSWQGVYDSVRTGGYLGLTGTARTLRAASQVFDTCATLGRDPDPARAKEALAACQASSAMPAQQKAFAQEAFDKARGRLGQIEGLMRKINATTDPKAIAELHARIAIEQAAIQNEQTKLQMYQLATAAERELQLQQAREIEARRWSSRRGITPPGH
jgi:type IV secretion system protein VirB5